MQQVQPEESLQTLQEIRSIMERSARFLSLSGMSGVWAGSTALVGAWIAVKWLPYAWIISRNPGCIFCDPDTVRLILLAISVFVVALAGGFFFTWKKGRSQGITLWNHASRQFLFHMSLPLIAGAVFCLAFIHFGNLVYLSSACLVFYGLALINGSKYTHSDIKYLGMLEVLLGSINLFFPGNGIYFWAFGFGVLHILYGIIMWNKYDKTNAIGN
jgi:hypothetical protein